MSDLANLQLNIIAQFVADSEYLEEMVQDESPVSQALLVSMQKEAEVLMSTARENHATLINMKKPTEAVQRYIAEDNFTKIRRSFHTYWAKIHENLIPEPRPEPTLNYTQLQETQIGGPRRFKVKLNPLTLPNFSGDIRTWKSYHNSFNSLVHNNEDIPQIDKFRYLLDSLSHEARSLINHLTLEESNYEVALKLLTNRYDHKRVLVNSQLNLLYNLEPMKKESAVYVRKTIDLVRECYQSLKGLGIDVNSWSPVIIFMVQHKLPSHLNQLWEEKLNNTKELPTFSQFEDFLECRFRALDILSLRSGTTGTNSSHAFHVQHSSDTVCPICNQSHFISNCKRFLEADQSARYKLVLENKLCINCLSGNHMLYTCTSKKHCKECPKRHHSLLHRKSTAKPNGNTHKLKNNSQNNKKKNPRSKNNNVKTQEVSQVYSTQSTSQNIPEFVPQQPTAQPISHSYHITSRSNKTYLLGTAVVQLTNDNGHSRTVRALLDPGSDDSFIINSIVNGLGIHKYYAPSSICVVGGNIVEGITHRCGFTIKSLHNDFTLKIDAGIKDMITPDLPKEPIPGLCYNFLNNLKLADPSFDEPGQIQLLLGVAVWVQLVQNGLVKSNDSLLIAQKTALGWVVQGEKDNPVTKYHTKISRCHTTINLDSQLQKFWELERMEKGKVIETPENILCEEIILKSIKRLQDGKLSVDLPFKNNEKPVLGKSKIIARNRFINLEKRLNQNSKLREAYHKTIKEYIDKGHMKLIEDDCNDDEGCYMPHHAVIKESSSTTQVRVVFDGSCLTSNQTSLNNHLLTGPKLQIDIRDILLRWRQYPIVLSADVEKMYRQFWVNEEFHKYQKVLWRFSNNKPLQTYALTTVTFGTSSAPYVALRLLKYIADTPTAKNFPRASKVIHTDFYVDDLMSGAYSGSEAVKIQDELRNLFSQFGLVIRKWCSNNSSVLQSIPSELCEMSEHSFDETDYKKTLGIYWSPSKDCFAFSVENQDFSTLKLTKRRTLSLIARLYDPLGWLGPCTTYAKIIMQRVWQSEVGWDDVIPSDIQSQFKLFLEDLQKLNNISIPRWIGLTSSDTPITLLGFADASETAYGCSIYLQDSCNAEGNILLTSRSRVAPLNFTTIARLELCAALLLAETLEWCEKIFSQRNIKIYAFSDSKIVLSWLQSHPSRWKTFVANRTSEILQRYDRSHWHYINTKENPADFISRGLLPSEILENHLWWKGPKNLELDQPFSLEAEQEQKMYQHESKNIQQCFKTQRVDNSLINYFSCNKRLFKRIFSITKFILGCLLKCCKTNPNKQQRYLEIIQKLQNPEHIVLRLVQHEHFFQEIHSLQNKKSLPKNSKLRTLSPFIDGFGILRSGSRLENSETLNYEQKYPIILPSHHQVTNNVIRNAHVATMHGNYKLMMAYIRNKFHIMRAKDRIKYLISRCVNCIRYAKTQQNQLMGSLPFPRVNESKPFLHTGVDFAGPMLIRNKFSKGSKTSKAYIAIFICMCTKAIHIELVSDLTSEAFLASLRRFVYRRGRVQVMHSDCGSNFKGASKTLLNECHEAQNTWKNTLQPQLEDLGIEWEFNPPSSPHFGGLWEAGVKSIKTHLNKTLKDAILTFEEYYTVLVQIEGILNSRPLCPVSDNPDSYEALTPSHFLVGEALVAPPEPKFLIKAGSSLKRWRYLQHLQQQFWIQWRGTYLHSLSKRPKWLDLQRNFEVNDLVLVTEDNFAPTIWPLARIIATYPGQDGVVRVVSLKTHEGKIFKRPIAKIRFLPIATQEDVNSPDLINN